VSTAKMAIKSVIWIEQGFVENGRGLRAMPHRHTIGCASAQTGTKYTVFSNNLWSQALILRTDTQNQYYNPMRTI
ncbi:unnamed protein product, partial [Rotaria socialis]